MKATSDDGFEAAGPERSGYRTPTKERAGRRTACPKDLKQNLNKEADPPHHRPPHLRCRLLPLLLRRRRIDDRDELSSHVQLPVREAGNREDGGKSRTEGWRGRRQPEEEVVPWWSVSAPAPVCVVFLRAVGAEAVWGGESGDVGRRRGKAGAVADDGANVDLAVEEEGSGERSSYDRGMEEA
jgi:hypothetical protein